MNEISPAARSAARNATKVPIVRVNARCMFCGFAGPETLVEADSTLLEARFGGGERNELDTRVVLCRNCQSLLAEATPDEGGDLTLLIRLRSGEAFHRAKADEFARSASIIHAEFLLQMRDAFEAAFRDPTETTQSPIKDRGSQFENLYALTT